MRTIISAILGVLILASFARAEPPAVEAADNWFHWRGPEANGFAPKANPPLTWDEKSNIKWKAPIPGRGSSTPIVCGDQVFVLTAISTDRMADPNDLPKPDPKLEKKTTAPTNYYQFVVLSFDRKTGKLRWQQTATEQVPHEGHHPTHNYAAGSPTTDGRRLYVSFGSRGTYCYDLDGKLLWSRDLGRLNTRFGWGEAVTPVIHGDNLLLNYDQEIGSFLICLDPATGKTKWKADRDEVSSWNTPLVVEHKGRTQVVLNGTNRIRSYDLETGKQIWECAGMTINAIPSLVARDGVVFAMSGYGKFPSVAISLDAAGDVTNTDKVLWQHTKGTPYVPSPLLLGDRLYFTQANAELLTTLDVKTGKPILDRQRLPGLKTLYASPVAAAGRVYVVDREGTTVVLKAGDKLEVLATNQLEGPIDASPALVGKQLFLRSEKFLYCIEGE
jgi:outer membrane protein assembly factor BamB